MAEARSLAAALELEAGEYDTANAELEKILRVNPRYSEAHALRAAQLYLQDRDFEPAAAQALAINPRYGRLYETLAHYATITRRTSEASEFARRAVDASAAPLERAPRARDGAAAARADGGRARRGREVFQGRPLQCLGQEHARFARHDERFRETRSAARSSSSSARRKAKYSRRSPPTCSKRPPRSSTRSTASRRKGRSSSRLFPNHEDFAVRALGLPGLGALGVCFGPVIAQDSPSARPEGQFNWGSTLWHEYAHVITLQMTDYRIPRWFSEGLSVYEERRARPGWGDDWNPSVLTRAGRRPLVQDRRSRRGFHATEARRRCAARVLSGVAGLRVRRRASTASTRFFRCSRSTATRRARQRSCDRL